MLGLRVVGRAGLVGVGDLLREVGAEGAGEPVAPDDMAGEVLAVGAIGAGEPLREPLGVLLDPQQEEGALRVLAEDALLGRGERAGVTTRELGDVGGVELEPGGAAAARALEADGKGPPADLEMQVGAEVEVAGGS